MHIYCPSLTRYQRFKTRCVMVGEVGVGPDLLLATHQAVHADPAVKTGAGDHCRVPGTPAHVKTPLIGGGQLGHHLS